MAEVFGIVIFALLIALSITLHELGHFIPAKRFGVKVTEFMIGFGPGIWKKTKEETTYGLKAIPLGGYIRMIGMLPPGKNDPDGQLRRSSTGRFASMISDARQQSLEEVGPGDENRVFYKLPVRKRVIIMLGGITMNLIFAAVLFSIVFVGIGLPKPSLEVGAVVVCTPSVTHPTGAPLPSGNCPTGTAKTPAVQAGLRKGDLITTVNGAKVSNWEAVSSQLRQSPGTSVVFGVNRNDATVVIPVAVTSIDRQVFDEAGNPTGKTAASGFVGISPGVEYVSQPWTSVPAYMWDITAASAQALVTLPLRLYELVKDTLIGGGERAMDGPVSVVGVSRLGGDIAAMDQPMLGKVAIFLSLAASLNLFLALFNLLPILPLDGGHVAGALYEAVRRWFAKVRGRPDPGPADVARLLPVAYVMAILLVGMGVIVIWADLVKPISLG
jgi:membrane-associated protease RseP (regulator of RpoE activity)